MKEEFKRVYGEMKLSNEAKERIMYMKSNESKIKKYRLRYAVVAAIIVGVYIATDTVSYAATGKTLVQHVVNTIQTDKNGDAELEEDDTFHMETYENSGFKTKAKKVHGKDGDEIHLEIYKNNTENDTKK